MEQHPHDPWVPEKLLQERTKRKLHPIVQDCKHLDDTNETYHLCWGNDEDDKEEYYYEFVQCYECLRKHFNKRHKIVTQSYYADKIQSFLNNNQGNT